MEDIIKETLVTNTEAKEIIKERKKEIELGYEQKNAYDYLKKYDNLTLKKVQELIEKLREVKKLRERQIITIVNVMPKDKDDLRLLLEKDYSLFTEEEKNFILENLNKFM
jgi:DNA-directed RNA polymerase subunit F